MPPKILCIRHHAYLTIVPVLVCRIGDANSGVRKLFLQGLDSKDFKLVRGTGSTVTTQLCYYCMKMVIYNM